MFQSASRQQAFLKSPNTQDNPFLRPGLGLPLDYAPMEKNIYGVHNRSMFPNSSDDRDIKEGNTDQPVQTLREFRMLRIMEEITDIPDWHKQVSVPDIAEDWKCEAMQKDPEITQNMANWIIDELQFKAVIYETIGSLALYNGDITKSDINVREDLRQRLLQAARKLEDSPPTLRFYNPGTNYKQEELIPVTFCCLVYGRTRVLRDKLIGVDDAIAHAGQGEVIPVPGETGITREDMAWRVASQEDIASRPFSRQFQYLPCEWNLKEDGKWHITSYINNVHPIKDRELYGLLEEIFNAVIPQLNAALTPLKDMLHSRARIEYHKAEYEPLPKDVADQEPQPDPHEAQVEFEDRQLKWRMKHWKAIQPDCGRFIPWAVPQWMLDRLPLDMPTPIRVEQEVDLNKEYSKRGLQTVIRIFNIHLTPDKPHFDPNWHGPGQMNDHACASAFYMLSVENTTTPVMGFRHIAETATLAEVEHEENDAVWLHQVYGLNVGDPAVQEPGRVRCPEGRTIIYPSTIQHRLERFELVDRSKSGCVKALGIFLVDPNIRIISTANVPPQRLDWTFGGDNVDELDVLSASLDKLSMGFRFQNRWENLPFSMNEARRLHSDVYKELFDYTKYTGIAFESKKVMA